VIADTLREVKDATQALATAREHAAEAEQGWRQAICAAMADKHPGPAVAAAAGITKVRVYQIRDGVR
jgi:hypothetical protein